MTPSVLSRLALVLFAFVGGVVPPSVREADVTVQTTQRTREVPATARPVQVHRLLQRQDRGVTLAAPRTWLPSSPRKAFLWHRAWLW